MMTTMMMMMHRIGEDSQAHIDNSGKICSNRELGKFSEFGEESGERRRGLEKSSVGKNGGKEKKGD